MEKKMKMTTKRSIEKNYSNGSKEFVVDILAKEIKFILTVNTVLKKVFYCSPSDLIPLSLGYLYIEGWIDIVPLESLPRVIVESADEVSLYLNLELQKSPREIKKRKMQCLNITPLKMMNYEGALLRASSVFQQTGAIHGAALFYQDELTFLGEDISRYHAFYKVVGKAIMASKKLKDMCLCTTGRLPMEYVEKLARTEIGIVVSRSAPTDLALNAAERYGIKVAGFASDKRVNIYEGSVGTGILAGGHGRRAGNIDKSQWRLDGESFLSRICHELPVDKPLWISYNRLESELIGKPQRALVIADAILNIGPMGGIYTILKECDCNGVLFVPCDMPFYNKKIGDVLSKNFTADIDAVVIKTKEGRLQHLCGIYGKSCLPIIEQFIDKEEYGIAKLLDMLRVKVIFAEEYGLESSWFRNINTKEEYELLKSDKEEPAAVGGATHS